MLTAEGFSPGTAGSIDGALQLASAAAGLFVGPVVGRLRDQKAVTACAATLQALALAGLLLRPESAILWAILFGLGTGAGFILGLSFVSLRAANVRQAAALSGMVQTVGYSVAAAAPPLAGMLHDRAGGWNGVLATGAILCAVMAAIGWRAGRVRHI
jgi:CP family cyanate transporter-like MFS transporter